MKIRCSECLSMLEKESESLDSDGYIVNVKPCKYCGDTNCFKEKAEELFTEFIKSLEIVDMSGPSETNLRIQKSTRKTLYEGGECDFDTAECHVMDGCCRTHQVPLSEKGKERVKEILKHHGKL